MNKTTYHGSLKNRDGMFIGEYLDFFSGAILSVVLSVAIWGVIGFLTKSFW